MLQNSGNGRELGEEWGEAVARGVLVEDFSSF